MVENWFVFFCHVRECDFKTDAFVVCSLTRDTNLSVYGIVSNLFHKIAN